LSAIPKLLFALLCLFSAGSVLGQLPTARLLTIFPPGAKAGSTCEVSVAGVDLEDARGIYFSHSNIVAVAQTNAAGKFLVSIGTNVLPGTYDVRVSGRYGISNPRVFAVGDLDEMIAKENDSAETALDIPIGSTVNGRAEANAVHYFKLPMTSGQRVTVRCDAANIDSRMDPSLILYDSQGRELKQSRRGGMLEFLAPNAGKYLLKVHDFLFAGGAEYFYRVSIRENTLQQELSLTEQEAIDPPCEIAGQFYPAGDVDSYTFQAKKGEVWWVEVFSHRLGVPTDPMLLINDQEFNDIESNAGGVEFRTSSLDCVGRFEAKEDGPCRVQVRDLFNRTANEPGRIYRLAVRKETPDFQLIAMPQGAPPKKDSREASIWSSVLRRGETIPIKVIALRQDGFKGDIAVNANDLPPGTTSSELTIAGDKTSGILLLTASESATNWAGPISIVAKANVGTHNAKTATVTWNVPDYNNERVRSRLTDNFVLAVCDDVAPIAVQTLDSKPYEVPASGKLAIPLSVIRRGEFNEAFKLKAYGISALDSLKEIEIKEKGTNATVELDMSQQKLPPGAYTFYLQGQTKGKYRIPGEKDKTKDVTITVYSPPIAFKVSPPQTAAK
jgi:hypothetical protein